MRSSGISGSEGGTGEKDVEGAGTELVAVVGGGEQVTGWLLMESSFLLSRWISEESFISSSLRF